MTTMCSVQKIKTNTVTYNSARRSMTLSSSLILTSMTLTRTYIANTFCYFCYFALSFDNSNEPKEPIISCKLDQYPKDNALASHAYRYIGISLISVPNRRFTHLNHLSY